MTETFYEVLRRQGITRRSFMKFCSLTATSLVSGCAERMKDSEQQVHSSPCSQITGVRGLVSSAWAIFGTKALPRPSDVAVRLQNFMKLRRVIPCRRSTS